MNTNAVMNAVFNGIGAVCVPISLNELYSSLQNGAVQASEGPWEGRGDGPIPPPGISDLCNARH